MKATLTLLISLLLTGPSFALDANRPSPTTFDRLHALMQPTPDELFWQQIPWLTRLWDARLKAAETGKPILLWEMDGNPLGCT